MRRQSLLITAACFLTQLATAQSVPTRSFMLGPTLGIDQVSYLNTDEYVGSPSSDSPTGITYGLDGSYQYHRLLVGAKLLYTNRRYQVTPTPMPHPLHLSDPDYFSRIDTDLATLTLPVSVGYCLIPYSRFQWYIGGNVAVSYLVSTSDSRYLSKNGIVGMTSQPDKSDFGKSMTIGYGAQTTLRYQLTQNLGLQLEPALRYYPIGGFPTKIYSTFQFQGTAAILVKL